MILTYTAILYLCRLHDTTSVITTCLRGIQWPKFILPNSCILMKNFDQRREITFQNLFIMGAWDKTQEEERWGGVVYVLVEN